MRAVVFDFDGLIVDTEWPAYVTVAAAFEAHGSSMPLERWQDRLGRGDNGPWTDLLIDEVGAIDVERVTAERKRVKDAMTDAEPVQPGVVEILTAAPEFDVATAVASSSPMSWVGRHLERVGLMEHFGHVTTRDHVERTKPWPDLFLAACAAVGADPAQSIAFEDSVHGVTSAKAAGMFCVAVPNRVTGVGDFSAADLMVDSLADFDLASHL